jgi:hypothetical protein
MENIPDIRVLKSNYEEYRFYNFHYILLHILQY